MAPRLIDLSRLSEKQLNDLSRHMRKDKHGLKKPEYRPEPADVRVFIPLAKEIARKSCQLDRIEDNFKASKFRHFESIRGDGFRSHLSYYLGFLFETSVQMAVMDFSRENPELLTIMHDRCGMLGDGTIFSADSRGSAIFYKQADNGRTLQTYAEIDMVGELHENNGVVPVIFEATLMNGHHRDFKLKRKADLLEEIYGKRPYFCVVRPAYDGEETGAHIQLGNDRGVWRDILIPRNDALRSLAMRLLNEEHEAVACKREETAYGA